MIYVRLALSEFMVNVSCFYKTNIYINMNNYATYKNLFTNTNKDIYGGTRGAIIKEKKNIIIVLLVIIIILFVDLTVIITTEKPTNTILFIYIFAFVFMGFYIFQSYIALTASKPKTPQSNDQL